MLEPGGYLQWEDFDIFSQEVISVQSSPTEGTLELSNFMKSNKNIAYVPSKLYTRRLVTRVQMASYTTEKFRKLRV